MNDTEGLIKLQSWKKLVGSLAPQITARRLPFREGIITAYRMLFNDEYDYDVRDYAVRLLFAIRDIYNEEWESDLGYDVLLGDACGLTWRYDEKFVTIEEAEAFVKKALEQELSIQAVVLIRGICQTKGDQKGFDYWDEVLEEVEKKQLWSRSSDWPAFLSEISLDD